MVFFMFSTPLPTPNTHPTSHPGHAPPPHGLPAAPSAPPWRRRSWRRRAERLGPVRAGRPRSDRLGDWPFLFFFFGCVFVFLFFFCFFFLLGGDFGEVVLFFFGGFGFWGGFGFFGGFWVLGRFFRVFGRRWVLYSGRVFKKNVFFVDIFLVVTFL